MSVLEPKKVATILGFCPLGCRHTYLGEIAIHGGLNKSIAKSIGK